MKKAASIITLSLVIIANIITAIYYIKHNNIPAFFGWLDATIWAIAVLLIIIKVA